MADRDDAAVQALARAVSEAMPPIAARVPPGPAAELGRIGTPPGRFAGRRPGRIIGWTGGAIMPDGSAESSGSPVLEALSGVRPLLAERLLGALELAVAALDLADLPEMPGYPGQPPAGHVAFALTSQDSQAVTAAELLERLWPGAAGLAASLARQLARHPLVAPRLAVPAGAADEASIAAAHGAGYLALATAVASAVIGTWQPPVTVDSPAAAVVGVAIGSAVLLLREAAMPSGYGAALLDKIRAEYLLPRRSSGEVPVAGSRFGLVEDELPATADFSANGLVTTVPGGAAIRTGTEEGSVSVHLTVSAQPPPLETQGWDEVVEVSWQAAAGLASVTGPDGTASRNLCDQTPPWPGDYRLRVHARGRDDADDAETYELAVWQAPAAPAIVHKRTDRLGYRLRGEPAPDRPPRPEHGYRWLRHSALSVAATVTVVTGSAVEDVLRAFGADPARPQSLRHIDEDVTERMSTDAWVAVLDTPAAVIAVEYNGYRGANEGVLRRASRSGRAASMYWNVNAFTTLSFAEGGHVLESFEPGVEGVDLAPGAAVAAALDGLDFEDYRDTKEKGLVAVERFTGCGITEEDLERIEAADVAFWVVSPAPGEAR